MSKPREIWWSYAKAMIRQYPQLHEEYKALHQQSMTMDYGGMPRGGGTSRGAETIALRELPKEKQLEYDAVRKAIAVTERFVDGRDRLKLIRLAYWDGGRVRDAALQIPCSEATAWRWHNVFVRMVWEFRNSDSPAPKV